MSVCGWWAEGVGGAVGAPAPSASLVFGQRSGRARFVLAHECARPPRVPPALLPAPGWAQAARLSWQTGAGEGGRGRRASERRGTARRPTNSSLARGATSPRESCGPPRPAPRRPPPHCSPHAAPHKPTLRSGGGGGGAEARTEGRPSLRTRAGQPLATNPTHTHHAPPSSRPPAAPRRPAPPARRGWGRTTGRSGWWRPCKSGGP